MYKNPNFNKENFSNPFFKKTIIDFIIFLLLLFLLDIFECLFMLFILNVKKI